MSSEVTAMISQGHFAISLNQLGTLQAYILLIVLQRLIFLMISKRDITAAFHNMAAEKSKYFSAVFICKLLKSVKI